jgi:hypothetical protein
MKSEGSASMPKARFGARPAIATRMTAAPVKEIDLNRMEFPPRFINMAVAVNFSCQN